MATTTSRLALYKPADDGSEYVDIATDINQNLDKLDAAIGFIPSSESTLPIPFAGMARQDTNTNRPYFRNHQNTSWVEMLSAAAPYDANIQTAAGRRLGIGRAPLSTSIIDAEYPTNAAIPASFRITGDTNPRVRLLWNELRFGDGVAGTDVSLARTGAGALSADADLTVTGELNVSGEASFDNLSVSGDLTAPTIVGPTEISGDLSITGIGKSMYAYKTTVTNRANTIILVDDPDLIIPVEANAVYLVRFMLAVTADNSMGFKSGWGVPVGSSGFKYCLGPQGASTSRDNTAMRSGIHSFLTSTNYGIAGTASATGITEQGVVRTINSGNISVQWAQYVSGGTSTGVNNGSYLEVIRIG